MKFLGKMSCYWLALLLLYFPLASPLAGLDYELFSAIQTNNISQVKALLHEGANSATRDQSGRTPLMAASEEERLLPIAKLLLQMGVVVDARDTSDRTALHYAAFSNNSQLVRELIAHGANVNAQNRLEETPLIMAAKAGALGSAQALLAAGATTTTYDYVGNSPLSLGIDHRNFDLVKELIDRGVSITAKGPRGEKNIFGAFLSRLLEGSNPKGTSADIKIAILLLNKYFENFTKTKKPVQEANNFYMLIAAFVERYKNVLLPEQLQTLSSLLEKLSISYNLTSFSKKHALGDLLKVFEVAVVDEPVLDNPADGLPKIVPGAYSLTQTESYLSIPELRQKVIEAYPYALTHYSKLIERIINQEKKFKDYFVFYHGQKRDFVLFYDVIKEIQQWFDNRSYTPDFEYVRLPEGQNKNISDYIQLGDLMNDQNLETNAALLPVNLSLFGNTETSGEATFDYFLTNTNLVPPKDLLITVFEKLGLSLKYIPQIIDLLAYLRSPTGNLLQIFIPKDKVNQYVYLSSIAGRSLATRRAQSATKLKPIEIAQPTPWYYPFTKSIIHDLKKIDTATYLNFYRNQPQLIDPEDLDKIQARIAITHDFLLEPKSGVKLFVYTTVHPDKLLEYHEKLRVLIKEVMNDWVKRTITEA